MRAPFVCVPCARRPKVDGLHHLEELVGSQETKSWRKLQDLNTSALQGWTFYETSNAYIYSWLCPLLYRQKQIHLTCENAFIVFGRNLTQFYEGKPQYSMDLTEAEIHLRPLYLQLKVRDKKKNYVIGFHSIKEYTFFVKSIKVQLEAKSRKKELWLKMRIASLHRACAEVVRRRTRFCDDSLYDMIREDINRQRHIVTTRSQRVWRLRTLARGWWLSCCVIVAVGSCCKKHTIIK